MEFSILNERRSVNAQRNIEQPCALLVVVVTHSYRYSTTHKLCIWGRAENSAIKKKKTSTISINTSSRQTSTQSTSYVLVEVLVSKSETFKFNGWPEIVCKIQMFVGYSWKITQTRHIHSLKKWLKAFTCYFGIVSNTNAANTVVSGCSNFTSTPSSMAIARELGVN